MLKEFTIKNFKSYKNEVTFSMEADYDRVNEHKEHVVSLNDNKLLKVASMYGPNGGGKTNLIDGISFIKAIVMNKGYGFSPREIVNVFSENNISEFTIFFVDDVYEYGFSIALSAAIEENENENRHLRFELIPDIKNEVVVYRKCNENQFVTLYERNENGETFGDFFDDMKFTLPRLSKSRTLLGKLFDDYANNDNNVEPLEIIKRLYLQFASIVNMESITARMGYPSLYKFEFIENNKKKLIEYLNSVDIKISNINIYKEGKPEKIYFEREIEVAGKVIKKEIPFNEESKGTKKIFNIIIEIMHGMNQNKIFYCDDMNSYLHPKLCASIIRQFTEQKNTFSQLIFNSHDLINMNNELFRRDEIWFAYRDEEYSSIIIPLSNIVNYKGEPIRNDAKFSKQYLEGKFGSDPFIMKGINWYE